MFVLPIAIIAVERLSSASIPSDVGILAGIESVRQPSLSQLS
jgi:hypothetical protein